MQIKRHRFDDARTHIEQAKLHAVNSNDIYGLALAMSLQAVFWHEQHRFEEAKSEALRALDIFERLGTAVYAEGIRELLRQIDHDSRVNVTPRESGNDGELLPTVPLMEFIDFLYSDRAA